MFTGTAREALALLADHWGWLMDMLDVIRPAETGELPGVAYTASLLVHEAWHAHQHGQGRRYYGRAAEQEAWAVQAVVLAGVSPGHAAVPWLLGSIAGLPDGGPLAGNQEV